jgi:hypothetical protein
LRASGTAEDFANVADEYSGSQVGAWARLQEAESHLHSGIRLSFADRTAARDDLQEAREAYDTVLANPAAPLPVRERALYGLARTLETLAGIQTAEKDGDASKPAATLDEAVAAYEQLLKQFNQTLYANVAKERIAELKKPSTQDFYAWFRQQNPTPADRALPRDGLPPGHPPLGGGLSFPGMPGDDIAPPRPPLTGETQLPPPVSPTPPTADPRERFLNDADAPIEAPGPAAPARLVDPTPESPAETSPPAQPQQ